MNNCAQCHGSDARGSKGFPNLTDTDWLHGGTSDKIKETITIGRHGVMPPMAAVVGTPDDVKNVANYVLSLSGSPHDSVRATCPRKAKCWWAFASALNPISPKCSAVKYWRSLLMR